MFLICGVFQAYFVSLVDCFNFSVLISFYFPLTRSVHTRIKEVHYFCGAQWLRIASSKVSTRFVASLPEDRSRAGFRNVSLSVDDGGSRKYGDCVSELPKRVLKHMMQLVVSVACCYRTNIIACWYLF
jgi:hypothetical protein